VIGGQVVVVLGWRCHFGRGKIGEVCHRKHPGGAVFIGTPRSGMVWHCGSSAVLLRAACATATDCVGSDHNSYPFSILVKLPIKSSVDWQEKNPLAR
jgi:hypothetical protein